MTDRASPHHVTGSSMRMLRKQEVLDLIAHNPKQFQIPDEYAALPKPHPVSPHMETGDLTTVPPRGAHKKEARKVSFDDDKEAPDIPARRRTSSGQARDLRTSSGQAQDLRTSSGQAQDLRTSSGQARDLRTSSGQARDLRTSSGQVRDLRTSSGQARDLRTSSGQARDLRTSSGQVRDLRTSVGEGQEDSAVTNGVHRTRSIDYITRGTPSTESDAGDCAEGVVLRRASSPHPVSPHMETGDLTTVPPRGAHKKEARKVSFDDDKEAPDIPARRRTSSGQARDLRTSSGQAQDLRTSSGQAQDLRTSSGQARDLRTSSGQARDLRTSSGQVRDLRTSSGQARDLRTSSGQARDLRTSSGQVRDLRTSVGEGQEDSAVTNGVHRTRSIDYITRGTPSTESDAGDCAEGVVLRRASSPHPVSPHMETGDLTAVPPRGAHKKEARKVSFDDDKEAPDIPARRRTSSGQARDLRTSSGQAQDLRTSSGQARDLRTSSGQARDLRTSSGQVRDLRTSSGQARDLRTSSGQARDLRTSSGQVRDLRTSVGEGQEDSAVTNGVHRTRSIDYITRGTPSTESDAGDCAEGVVLRRASSRKTEVDCVDFEVFLTESQNMLRGVLELSTLHHDVIDKVKLRVVCVFDVSGSMLLKCGRSRQHSKLSKLKKMAADLVDVMEEGDDYFGIVAFGEETRVVCPLTKVDSTSRGNLKETITALDKAIDSCTDLVQGIHRAVDLLKSGHQASDPAYRNAIIVFSDGEINSGITNADEVVHAVRQRIRDSNPDPRNQNAEQWLSVACVTTGGHVSQAMYLVSKYCGNDAYYYVDSDLAHPEVDMLIPLLLRKSAIAQYVTLDIKPDNGAALVEEKCTREHSVRRRRTEKKVPNIMYYLHDLPAGSQKHFSIAIDLSGYKKDSDNDVMRIQLEYCDAEGDTHHVTRTIRFSDRLTALKDPDKYEKAVLLSAKADMRSAFQIACRDAAEVLTEEGDPSTALHDGTTKLQQLMEHYGVMAKREETKHRIADFSRALVCNLDRLIESMEKSRRGNGHKWSKLKAVSSAVVRETPNVSKLVAKSEFVCPLPVFKNCATTRMTALALKLYRKQEVTSVVFPNQNLFDAAKVVMQSLSDIVGVLQQVEAVPVKSNTLRRKIITTSMVLTEDMSDEEK
ncbi:uncharacterized protein LOC124129069 isoform X2 [Haliotis rufescens]|uniref:uncharacterized protein LOC124129069 isoform X2 n=1 Tax=Haliotis rufescens TaxID=6454 RepID=UPI00201F5305|nr:uncharacterized protein LOC124129069 isoform X2 [Haliotis rufescens]